MMLLLVGDWAFVKTMDYMCSREFGLDHRAVAAKRHLCTVCHHRLSRFAEPWVHH